MFTQDGESSSWALHRWNVTAVHPRFLTYANFYSR